MGQVASCGSDPSPGQLCPTPPLSDSSHSVPPLPRGLGGGQVTCHLGSGYTLFEISEPNFGVSNFEGCSDNPKDLQQRGNIFCVPLVATQNVQRKEKLKVIIIQSLSLEWVLISTITLKVKVSEEVKMSSAISY